MMKAGAVHYYYKTTDSTYMSSYTRLTVSRENCILSSPQIIVGIG